MMAKQNGTRPKQICKLHSLAPKNGSKISLQPKVIQSKGRSHFCLIIGQNEDQFSPDVDKEALGAASRHLTTLRESLKNKANRRGGQRQEDLNKWSHSLGDSITFRVKPYLKPALPLDFSIIGDQKFLGIT